MKKLVGFTFFIMILCLPFISPEASTVESENSAQQFAKKYFTDIVLDHVNSEEHSYYNLSESTNITYGKLYKVYRLSNEFVTTKKTLSDDLGIEESTEYIAAVYQDGKPVNVIGTAKDENGKYILSTFGYGKDLAEALDNKETNGGKIFYEPLADAWYIFEKGKVKGFTINATLMLGGDSLSLPEFREYIYDKYASHDEIIENGQQTSVSGDYSTPYKPKENNMNYSFIYIGIIIASIIFIIFKIRKKKILN